MMRLGVLMISLTALISARAATRDLTVALPPGETHLADIGIYRVAYQSYGKDIVEMPLSWAGHFEGVSGISYVPSGSGILLHSPWRVAAGKVWVDYRLKLPNITPIALSFGIVVTKDKSDGVTFSCCLIDGGNERELMRRHQVKGKRLDYNFDLGNLAGKEITLRLQTEPGPDNSPGWDYSYFRDARIMCGEKGQSHASLLTELTGTKAYRATRDVNLARLCNDPKNGVVPSNLLPHKNAVEKVGTGYRLTYEGDDCRVAYSFEPRTGTLDDLSVRIDDGSSFQVARDGGVRVAVEKDGRVRHVAVRGGKAVESSLSSDSQSVRVVWEYPIEADSLRVEWTFGIVGKALVVGAKSDKPVVSSFSLGSVMVPLRKTFRVPYLPISLSYLPARGVFACRCLDWTKSHASTCPGGRATYVAKTDGTRNPLRETGYIAVSPNVHEVLPNIPHPPSPYIDLLGPRIMLDVWGHHKGTYQGDAENLRALKDNGVDHLAIISHNWQRYGYDKKLPDHLPANPRWGGDEGMIEFGKAANECGYVWSLHENYIDFYPDAPSYDPADRVLRADGSPSPAWRKSFGLKCNRALHYAKQNSPEIHRRFKTTAAYLDVHTCVAPWHQLDHEANQPMAAMALAKVKYDTELFQFERDTHEGPLFGEGSRHFYWAGLCDGVEAQVGEHHTPFLDFDLLKLHPQMVNHGVGYYEPELTAADKWNANTGVPWDGGFPPVPVPVPVPEWSPGTG